MFILFCLFAVVCLLFLLSFMQYLCIQDNDREIGELWETIDEDEELFTNLCEELDDLEESVDDILAYLEDGGEKK